MTTSDDSKKDATVEFTLFAPYLEWAALVASFLPEPLGMQKDGTGTWRCTCRVPSGTHKYRFRIRSLSPFMDGHEVEVTDPKARLVDESDGDASVVVVRDGQDVTTDPHFQWEHDGFALPDDPELIIYEMHVGEFGWKDREGRVGGFRDVIPKLQYLAELGVNAIELMPVSAFPTDASWGYNVRHFFAVENAYGAPSDLKGFVDACHGHGMRVILDKVLNHAESDCPLAKIDFNYWFRNAHEGEQSFGTKFDHLHVDEHLGLRPAFEFALDVVRYWVREFHVDGYRLDATSFIDNFELISAIRRESKHAAGNKPFFVVAEHIPEDPSIAGPDGPADGAWHYNFMQWSRSIACQTSGHVAMDEVVRSLQPRNAGYVSPGRVVNYIESHDEQTLMEVLAAAGLQGEVALRRHKLVASLLFTAVGVPMLHQGQEFAGHRPRSLDIRPLQWDILDTDYGLHLKEHYAFLARTRQSSPALKGEEFEVIHSHEDDGVLVFRRGYGEAAVVVTVNFHDADQNVKLPFPDGAYRELTFGYDMDVSGGVLEDTLPPSAVKIYVPR